MTNVRVSRRRFLAMLGVLMGGSAAGLAWWRDRAGPATAPSMAAPDSTPSTTRPGASSTTAPPTATTSSASATTAAPATTAIPTTTTSGTMAGLAVICRDAWEAAPIRGELVDHRIRWLTVHHTAVATGSNRDAPRRIRSYQAYHQDQGWPDIAYHYLIDANGHVYEGRPLSARGDTFTEYDPSGHFLVCCDGHFDRQEVPAPQLGSLVDVLAWASVRFGVAPDTIAGHRAYATTTCPGKRLDAVIAGRTLQSMVEERIASGAPSMVSLCGPAGRDRVADIEAGRL